MSQTAAMDVRHLSDNDFNPRKDDEEIPTKDFVKVKLKFNGSDNFKFK